MRGYEKSFEDLLTHEYFTSFFPPTLRKNCQSVLVSRKEEQSGGIVDWPKKIQITNLVIIVQTDIYP